MRLYTVLRLILITGLLGLLSGCGFTPLYGDGRTGQTSAAISAVEGASQIRILPIADRQGQILHNLLRDRLNPTGQPFDPRFELSVTLSTGTSGTFSGNIDGVRSVATATGAYRLTRVSDKKLLLSGSRRQEAPFTSVSITGGQINQFAVDAAKQRATQLLADDLSRVILLYFHQR